MTALFISAFIVGFSGALMPGPMFTATVSESMKRGFRAGPLIVLGHAIPEIVLLLLVLAGIGDWLTQDAVRGVLGTAGGALLGIMGVQMTITSRKAVQEALAPTADRAPGKRGGPVLLGILTSIAHPYWTLWWATIGLGYAAMAMERGWMGLVVFYVGHVLSDLAWFSFVSFTVASGRRICPPGVYRAVIIACGATLLIIGAWFLRMGLTAWQMMQPA